MWAKIQQASGTSLALAAIVPAVILFVSSMLIVALVFGDTRVDLTERQIYTLSDSTKEVLEAVEEPITLRLFLSSSLAAEAPSVRVYSERVNEMLRSYERLSDGLISIEWIDPAPFSPEEDSAIAYNLIGFNLSRAGEQGYFGLVGTNSLDRIETINALSPSREQFLEYDLTRMVLRLSNPTEPVVGVIDGLGLFGNTAQNRLPTAVIERLGEDFALQSIPYDITAIPDDLDALLVVHPHNLSQSTLYAIDQYVIRGGPAVVFLEAVSEHSPPDPNNTAMPQYPDSNLEPIMAAWGAVMLPQRVVGDTNMALEVRGQAGGQVVVSDYIPWLIVDADNLNQDDIVTAQLSLMRIQTAGALLPTVQATTTFTPLIQTTTESMLVDQATILRRMAPDILLNQFVASGERYTLAARIVGPVSTAFPDGPPPLPTQQPGADPYPDPVPLTAQSVQPINVIVVSDTDMLTDDLNVTADGTPNTQNADFLINAIDSLTGGGQLIDLRSRGLVFRPFTRVDQFEAAADERYRETEQALQAELADIEAQLEAIRARALVGDGPIGALTLAQQEAIDEYNQRIVEVRLDLREVQSALREEIDSLTTRLELINIAATPVLVILIGLFVWFLRREQLRRYLRRSQTAE